MARHRRRRGFGSTVGVNLGRLPLMGESVSTTDVLIGVGVGIFGSAAVKAALKNFAPSVYSQISSTVGNTWMPAVAGAAVAAATYFGGPKLGLGKYKATGIAAGAAAVGGALSLWDLARNTFAGNSMLDFSGTVGVNLGGYGMLIDDSAGQGVNGMNGMIVADHSDGLSELAAVSMGPDDDGIDALMSM